MKIEVFAVLKDYFEPEFEVETNAKNIDDLRQRLLALQPCAQNVLNISRFAVNDEFIDNNFQLKESDTICIIPPSSGG
jgi:molybdopterin synthase sulfur carrier subunit